MYILTAVIYLIGCVLAYIMGKKCFVADGIVWTRGNRKNMLILSLFSWLAFTLAVIAIIKNKIDDDTPAKC